MGVLTFFKLYKLHQLTQSVSYGIIVVVIGNLFSLKMNALD